MFSHQNIKQSKTTKLKIEGANACFFRGSRNVFLFVFPNKRHRTVTTHLFSPFATMKKKIATLYYHTPIQRYSIHKKDLEELNSCHTKSSLIAKVFEEREKQREMIE